MVVLEFSETVHVPKSEITAVDIPDVFMVYGTEIAVDVQAKFKSPMSMKAAFVKLSHVFSDENYVSWRKIFPSDDSVGMCFLVNISPRANVIEVETKAVSAFPSPGSFQKTSLVS